MPARAASSEEAEASLIARARVGDDRAIHAIYGRHVRYVASVVYRLMGSDADVDDIVQETFLDGLDALGSLERPEALRGFLVTIAVRRAQRLLSQRRRRNALLSLFNYGAPEPSSASGLTGSLELYQTLAKLPADIRVAWTLARIHEFALPEVAKSCDVSLATVKRRIAEGDERLARMKEQES
jgi:RNA polymerase sigma-70 factor, ECF subfamily